MKPRRVALLLLASLGLTSTWCHAGDPVCVSNEPELRQALTDAAAGLTDEIRLMEGTYFTGGQLFSYDTLTGHNLSISGGWYYDHDPCDFQHQHADGTILDGQNVTSILSISNSGNVPGTTLSISNLTLRNGATSTNNQAAALSVFGALGQDLRIQNVVVLSSHNTRVQPLTIFTDVVTMYAYANVYFINNVIGDCTSNYANLAIFTDTAAQTVYMSNNTLSINGAGYGALLDANNGTKFRLVNNAINGAINFNSRNGGDPIQLWMYSDLGYWNYSSIVTAPVIQADSGNDQNLNLQFMGALDFRPAPGSPLVNRGLNAPLGGSSTYDLDSNARVDLGFIDVGAYESTHERIFANGFQ